MRPSRRSLSISGHLLAAIIALFLAFLPAAHAQKPSGPPTQNPPPSPRKVTVITNDNLKYSVLSQPERPADTPPQPVSIKEKDASNSAEEAAKKAAEIASLQKQIKDKQKRIELLMHLFVMEEKKFVQSSGDLDMDSDLQAKIHYEQEELRRETAACAQLQAQLDALQASAPAPR